MEVELVKLIGRTLIVVYDDGEKAMRITGRVIGFTNSFLDIHTDGKERYIQIGKIIRMEEVRP